MRVMKIILKIFVFLIIVAVVGYITYLKKWPWWVGASIIAIILALYILYAVLKRFYIRKKEKKFIKDVAQKISKKPSLDEIHRQWEEYFKILRSSGKNVYDLPWIMVIGESGSGKTSLIKYSGLSLPLTPVSRSKEIFSTKYCDWWFFEEAVVLDTAGRYSVAQDMEIDEKEWEELLNLLSETRQKEPLNAIVCVVSVDKIDSKEKMKLEAENLRARVNDVMKKLGVRIPVFLMITKMDRVGGFVDFFDYYRSHLNEVMGLIVEGNFNFDNFKKTLLERVETLLEQMEKYSYSKTAFLEEFEIFLDNLNGFFEIFLEDSTYLEKIDFKGVYFSSAIQDECKFKFFENLGIPTAEKFNSKTPFFIKDFFKEILPSVRGAYEIIKKYLSSRFRYKKAVFYSVLLLLAGFFGIITYSFYREYNLIKKINIKPLLENSKNINKEILNLHNFKVVVEEYKYQKNKISFTLYPFSQKAEDSLESLYVKTFEKNLLNRIKNDLANNIGKIKYVNDYSTINDYVGFLVDTILSLKEKLNSKEVVFSKYFAGFVKNFLIVEENLPPEIAEMFADEYLTYLKWNNNYVDLNNNLSFFQNQLEDIINAKPSLKWLTDKSVSLLNDITLSDFWDISYSRPPFIKGAFTIQGWKNMLISINQLKESVKDKNGFLEKLKRFKQWYNEEYLREWYTFASRFDIENYVIKNNSYLLLSAPEIITKNNPYYKFLKRADYELGEFKKDENWLKLLSKFEKVTKIASSINSKNSLIEKLEKEKEKVLESLNEKLNTNIQNIDIKRAVYYNNYMKNLSNIGDVSDLQESYSMVQDLFSSSKDSKLLKLYNSFERFKSSMPYTSSEVIWNLIKGPVNFVFNASIYNASKVLNTLWNQKVLSNLNTYTLEELYGKDGYVRKFLNNTLSVYLMKTPNGYVPRSVFGYKIPFTKDFLRFLDTLDIKYANRKQQYTVDIKTLPIEVNNDSLLKPYESQLIITCGSKKYTLTNFNYQNELTFNFDSTCSTTKVKIYFPGLVLEKKYKSFVEFLKSLKNGTLVLTQKDFSSDLKAYKIKWVKLPFIIDDGGLLKSYQKINVPMKICY